MKAERLNSIDYLKGIGILMVIFVHSAQRIVPFLPIRIFARYSQMGCQLLFLISAFTLCLSYQSNPVSVKDFYKKRFLAIAPAYYIGIVFYFIFNKLCIVADVISPVKTNTDLSAVAVNFLFLNGLFPFANNNVVFGGWFIGTIVIFYISAS